MHPVANATIKAMTCFCLGPILITDKSVEYVAELTHILAGDQSLRKNVIASQREALKRFKEKNREAFLLEAINNL